MRLDQTYLSPPFIEEQSLFQACNLGDPDKINVHVIPHSHDDVGWQKTVEEYYYGSMHEKRILFLFIQMSLLFCTDRDDIRHAGVQFILDSVILALDENPDRRFIYVEMAFFWRWWIQQNDQVKDKVRQFVNEGTFCFVYSLPILVFSLSGKVVWSLSLVVGV